MKKILHLTLFLAIVSALAGSALAYANQLTAPVIKANNEKIEKETLRLMYPDASDSDFKTVDISDVESRTIQKVYQYNELLIFNMKVNGYKDGTTFLVSINTEDHSIDNFYGISNGDTKGLGSQVLEDPFKESLLGKNASEQLDTISGATVSSTPVVDGIHEAESFVDTLK